VEYVAQMPTARRLVLMRHAKASSLAEAPTDHARPLEARGRKDAPAVAARLLDLGWSPELVVCSDATRTQETWACMEGAFDPPPGLRLEPGLYAAGLDALRRSALDWDPTLHTVLALGHNPGWELAALSLSGRELALKTGGCVLLEGAGATWAQALARPWRLVEVLRPRELR